MELFSPLSPDTSPLIYGILWPTPNAPLPARIGYSFPQAPEQWTGYTNTGQLSQGYVPFTENQRDAARQALSSWQSVANIAWIESVAGDSTAELRFGNSAWQMDARQLAYTYLPGAGELAGDIWLNSDRLATDFAASQAGTLAYFTLLHEIGHALGLKHPDQPSPFNPSTLPVLADSLFSTVMSDAVWPGVALDATASIDRWPTTPMSLDIDAIQTLYGPTLGSHTGDDVYTFDSAGLYLQTLFDTDGIDWIKLTGAAGGTIDLRPGHWSQLGPAVQILGGLIKNPQTVQIYQSSLIENAAGGDGNDTLIGNAANNVLIGGRGADTFVLDARSHDTVLDFDGPSGDRLDLSAAMAALPQAATEPFAMGYLSLTDTADGLLLSLDPDGAAGPTLPAPIATLPGYSTANMRSAYLLQDLQLNQPAALTGFLVFGTAGDDVIEGGPNDDRINGREGNDTLLWPRRQ